jgi:hypothetical protein
MVMAPPKTASQILEEQTLRKIKQAERQELKKRTLEWIRSTRPEWINPRARSTDEFITEAIHLSRMFEEAIPVPRMRVERIEGMVHNWTEDKFKAFQDFAAGKGNAAGVSFEEFGRLKDKALAGTLGASETEPCSPIQVTMLEEWTTEGLVQRAAAERRRAADEAELAEVLADYEQEANPIFGRW